MKNTLIILVIIFFCSLGCNRSNDSSLDGIWDRGDIEIQISGNSATFHEIEGKPWLSVMEIGQVSVGDLKIKNIQKTGDLTWSCDELWFWYDSGGAFEAINWSTSCTITMSDSHNTISLSSEASYNEKTDYSTTIYQWKSNLP